MSLAHDFLSHYDLQGWLYGMWVAVASGIADGVLVGGLLNASDPKDWNTTENRFWNLILPVIAILGAKSFFLYIRQNPAPRVIVQESTKTTVMPSGAVSVEAKVTTTPVEAPLKEEKK